MSQWKPKTKMILDKDETETQEPESQVSSVSPVTTNGTCAQFYNFLVFLCPANFEITSHF